MKSNLPQLMAAGPQAPPAATRWRSARDAVALLIAMLVPSLMTWLEFTVVPYQSEDAKPTVQAVFLAGKGVQFLLPLVFVLLVEPRAFVPSWPTRRYLLLGVVFGLIVGAGALALYFLWLRDTTLFDGTAGKFVQWLEDWGLATPAAFWTMAVAFAAIHSLLEEAYWRWFVFGWLRRYLALPWALAISSVGFMAHHVVILSIYLPGNFWLGVVPFSLCVALGGVIWGWLYDRGGSLIPVWISHALVDLALMLLGWDLALQYWAKAG